MFSKQLEELVSAIDSQNLTDSDLCRILTLRTFSGLGATSTFFCTVDSEGNVHTRGIFGFTEDSVDNWLVYPLHITLPSTDSIKQGKTIWEFDLPKWSDRYKELESFSLPETSKSFVCWPIMRDMAPIGSMGFYSNQVLDPSPEFERFLETVGRLVAIHLRISSKNQSFEKEEPQSLENIDQLTIRQRKILDLIAAQQTNSQIAQTLGYSSDTIRLETMKIYRILSVSNRYEAADAYRKYDKAVPASA